jgi:hypothetical protein
LQRTWRSIVGARRHLYLDGRNQKDPSTGTYRLQLYNIPLPDRLPIKIGDKIKPGMPAAGAGRIEAPGAEDIYTFQRRARSESYIHLLDRAKGMEYINWRLVDDNGMEVFNACLACSEPGVQTLTKGGTYTLTVGNPRNRRLETTPSKSVPVKRRSRRYDSRATILHYRLADKSSFPVSPD